VIPDYGNVPKENRHELNQINWIDELTSQIEIHPDCPVRFRLIDDPGNMPHDRDLEINNVMFQDEEILVELVDK
jgi:hypothetical protein